MLELTAWDLIAIQKVIIVQAKQTSLNRQATSKDEIIKVSKYYLLCLEKKEKIGKKVGKLLIGLNSIFC